MGFTIYKHKNVRYGYYKFANGKKLMSCTKCNKNQAKNYQTSKIKNVASFLK